MLTTLPWKLQSRSFCNFYSFILSIDAVATYAGAVLFPFCWGKTTGNLSATPKRKGEQQRGGAGGRGNFQSPRGSGYLGNSGGVGVAIRLDKRVWLNQLSRGAILLRVKDHRFSDANFYRNSNDSLPRGTRGMKMNVDGGKRDEKRETPTIRTSCEKNEGKNRKEN